jgi:cystathionine gamma-synthase
MSSSPEKKVHIVVPKTCYDESVKMIKIGSGGYSSFIRVDMTDTDAVNSALSKHPDRGKILFLETPDNPYTQICDLEALVKIARSHNAVTIVDTTWSPPLVGQVFRYNVDAVCMSCTKTMGGHSDVLCGAVVTNGETRLGRKLFPRVRDWQICHGGVASPFDCWLVLRGLRTLPVRIERMCKTALRLATFLENHPSIEWVRHPGLESHPQHELAKKQMDMFGQICTFCIAGGSNAAMSFVGAVQLATRATSTGGTETLVQHQRSIEMVKVTPGGVIRVSVGLEDEDDLVEDFAMALLCAERVCENLQVESWSPSCDDND